MPALAEIDIIVRIDSTAHTFTAEALQEQGVAPSLAGALAALATRIGHVHDELQDVGDGDLTEQGRAKRDTPMAF